MKKRIVCLLLTVIMLLGLLPTAALAVQEMETQSQETAASPIVMDFKAMAKEAAKQSWWNDLKSVQTKSGHEAKLIGSAYSKSMTDEELAAYDALRQWLSETYGWTINNSKSSFTAGNGNRFYLCADDAVAWGMEKWSYLININDRNSIVFDVQAETAGWYNLQLQASLQTDASTNYVTDYIGEAGGGYATISVNDKAVYTDYSFIGTGTRTSSLGAVWLEEGTNTLRVRNTKDIWGQTNITGRSNADMVSMTLTPLGGITVGEGEETVLDLTKTWLAFDALEDGSVPEVSCEDENIASAAISGGKVIVEGIGMGDTTITVTLDGSEVCTVDVTVTEAALVTDSIRVDFKEFAKRASTQSWWRDLPDFQTNNSSAVKRIGGLKTEIQSAEEKAAVHQMAAWMEETLGWSFDVAGSGLGTYTGNRVYLSAQDDVAWGVARNGNINFADGSSDLAVIVQTDNAGWYDLTMELVHQDDTSKDWVSDTDVNAGGGYGDLYVNGEKIVSGYKFRDEAASPTVICSFGSVYLQEGENTIAMRNVGEYNVPVCPLNGWTGGRSNMNFTAMTLTPVGLMAVEEGSALTIGLEKLLPDADDYTDAEVVSDDETVVQAVISGSVLNIRGLAQGKAAVRVTADGEEMQFRVKVVEKTALVYDFTKACSVTADGFDTIESYEDLDVDDVPSDLWCYASGKGKWDADTGFAAASKIGFTLNVTEQGWFEPQLLLARNEKGGIVRVYLDDHYLGTVDTYCATTALERRTLRPVELTAGEHTLTLVQDGSNALVAGTANIYFHSFVLKAVAEPVLTLDVDRLADKKGRVMSVPVIGAWEDGRMDTLYGAELSVEVSDEALLEASVTEAALTEHAKLSVKALDHGEDLYVTVTAQLDGIKAEKVVPVTVLETAEVLSMDASLYMAPNGVIPRATTRAIVFDMPGADGSNVMPDEVNVSYDIADPAVAYVNEDDHTLTALADGETDITITVEQSGNTFTDTIHVTVGDAGENLFEADSSSFDSEAPHWTIPAASADQWTTATVADDGTGNRALKISFNPNTTANIGGDGFNIYNRNGKYAKLEPGQLYELTFRVRVDGYQRPAGAIQDPRLIIQGYDWRGNGLSTGVVGDINCNADILYAQLEEGVWHELSVPVRAPADATATFYYGIDMSVRAHYGYPTDKDCYGFKGDIWIDDIELREIGFESVKIDYITEPYNTSYPFKVLVKPYTTTGREILLDEGAARGNFRLTSSDDNILRVAETPEYIHERAHLWTEYWTEYATYDVHVVGKNDTATLTAACTIGDETREGTLDVTILNQPEVLRDIYVKLDGFESLVLPVGKTAKATISGLTTELNPVTDFSSVYFTSSDTAVAKIDSLTGEISTFGEGTVTITGYGLLDAEAVKGKAILTVTDDTDLASIEVGADTEFVAESNFRQMGVTGKKSSGVRADMDKYPVTWSLDDAALANGIAVISETGRLSALKAGTVTVTATVGVDGKSVSDSMVITVTPNAELPANIVVHSFVNGNGPRMDTATLETDGIEIDRERTYNNFEGNEWSKTGFAFNVPVGEELYMNFLVERSGWYKVEVRGMSIYYYGCLTGFYIDDMYVGSPDFGGDVGGNYDAGGVYNTVYLEAGEHTMRLQAEESRRICLGEVTMYPVADPREISFDAQIEENVLITGEQTKLSFDLWDSNTAKYFLHYAQDVPEYTNYYTVTSSNPSVVSVTNDLFDTYLVAGTQGTATVTVNAEILGKAVSKSFEITVVQGSIASAELTAEFTTVRPDAAAFPLTVKASGLSDEIALPEGCSVTYESADTSIATVTADGIVNVTGTEGSVLITAHLTEGVRTMDLPLWITVSAGKTEPTIYTWEERAAAQENVTKYSWAWDQKEAVVAKADYYVANLEHIYNLWPAEGLPRNTAVGYTWDHTKTICEYCKTDVAEYNGGYYQWKTDPINNPWKVTCPACNRDFPSNDFESFYKCGLDEHGVFTVERAMENGGEQYLVNELYPEMGEGWGVDNGYGWFKGEYDEQGREYVRTYIAYFMEFMLYTVSEHTGIHSMPVIFDSLREAYLYTGDAKYGNAGAILLDRMADIYPDYSLHYYSDIPTYGALNAASKGKITNLTWEAVIGQCLAKAADAFWPCCDNTEVVDFLRGYADRKGVAAEDITPQYLRENVDNGILREIGDACRRCQMQGNFGMHQAAMALAAVALDTQPETNEMLEWVFSTEQIGGLYQNSWNLGGDVNRVLIELVDRDGFGNESSIGYNYIWLTNLKDMADALDGYAPAAQYDLWNNPKFVNMYKAFMNLTVCGRLCVDIHETPSPWQQTGAMVDPELMTWAYLGSGDREIAQMIYFSNGNSVTGLHADIFTKNPESGLRTQIQQIVNEDGPWNLSKSTWLAGAGEAIGILRRGPETYVKGVNEDEFFDTWMDFGLTNSHSHWEALNLELDAFGLPLNGNMGYPAVMTGDSFNRLQWIQHTVSNNTVVVNDEPQKPNPEAGFPLHFDGETDKVRIMDADSPNSYDAADIYRRTVLTVQGDNGIDYTVDFFRVLGGSEHVYSFHGASSVDPATDGLSLQKQPFGTYAGADVPFGDYDYTGSSSAAMNQPCGYSWLWDVYRDSSPSNTFTVDWAIEDYQHQLSTSAGIHLRLTMLNDKPMAEVALANGEPAQDGRAPDHVEFLLVRNSGEDNLDTLFSSVIEPYQTEIQIASAELVEVSLVEGTEHPTDRVRAIKVTLNTGRVDYIVYATNSDCTYDVDGMFRFRGFVGVCQYRNGQLVYAYGNEATQVADVIEEAMPKLTGSVVDFSKELSFESSMTITMNESYPVEDLTDKYIYVNNDGLENAVYRIYGAEENADGTITLDMHTQDFIREWVDEWNFDLGYLYNIAEGQSYTIPLPTVFDALAFFNHTSDQVIKAGNKLSVTCGVAGSGAGYEAEGMPSGMKITAANGVITWSTSKTQTGRYPITVKAVRDGEVVGSMSFVVYVLPYSGSSYAQDVCAHSKAVTYTVDGIVETVCPACGLVTRKAAEEEIEKFDIVGSNMTLGNELRLNVLVKSSDLGDGTYTARITHNGETTQQTLVKYNGNYHCVTVAVAAKQMADVITVEVFDEDGSAVSNIYKTSVRTYAMNLMGNAALGAKLKTLVVDMLNYGAAAQTYFVYNASDLADAQLTADQKALATRSVSCTNRQVKGENFYGANLSLEDKILLNVFFRNVTDDMYAEITYTDYQGNTKTIEKQLVQYSASIYKVVIDDIVLADSFCPVAVTVYNADGTVHGSGTDSVESYIARTGATSINEAIMKFAYSAKQYLS